MTSPQENSENEKMNEEILSWLDNNYITLQNTFPSGTRACGFFKGAIKEALNKARQQQKDMDDEEIKKMRQQIEIDKVFIKNGENSYKRGKKDGQKGILFNPEFDALREKECKEAEKKGAEAERKRIIEMIEKRIDELEDLIKTFGYRTEANVSINILNSLKNSILEKLKTEAK